MTLFLAMGNSLDRFQGLHPIDYWAIVLTEHCKQAPAAG